MNFPTETAFILAYQTLSFMQPTMSAFIWENHW